MLRREEGCKDERPSTKYNEWEFGRKGRRRNNTHNHGIDDEKVHYSRGRERRQKKNELKANPRDEVKVRK